MPFKWPVISRNAPSSEWYQNPNNAAKCNSALALLAKGLYPLVETEKARLMIEIDKVMNLGTCGPTDNAAREIRVYRSCGTVLEAPANKRLFANFPNEIWLLAALKALYRYECKNRGQKQRRVTAGARPTGTKRVKRTNDHITANTNDGTQTLRGNRIAVEKAVGPHHLLPLDINPRWKEQCPATFPKGLKTLDEARTDSSYLELWKGRLPEVSRETTDSALHISGMMFPVIRTRGKQQSFLVGEGGQDVEDAELRDTCIGKALYQLHRQTIDTDEEICAIRNVVLSEARQMSLNSAWAQGAPLCKQEPAEGQSFIAAPKGYFTDFHNDSATVGKVTVIGECTKVFLCFASSDHNLDIWARSLGTENKLMYHGKELEGATITRISNSLGDEGNSLTIPAGTTHAVFTMTGGFMGGINSSTWHNLQLMAYCIRLQICRAADSGIMVDIVWYEETLHASLKQGTKGTIAISLSSLAKIIQEMDKYPGRKSSEVFKRLDIVVQRTLNMWKRTSRDEHGGCRCDCDGRFKADRTELAEHMTQFHPDL